MPETFPITITRSRRSTISLSVSSTGVVEIRAPYLMPKFFINQFIEKNSSWIEKRMVIVQKQKKLQKSHTHGEKYLYLGKEYTLDIGNYTAITIVGETLQYPKALEFRIEKEIENWYIKQAREIISKQTHLFAQEMHTSFLSLTFSDTKSQWGRCSHDNRLQFSWRLVMTPFLVINYVVIHELAHTIEKNHSIAFWRIVRSVMPSYRQQIKWLKLNGNTLVV